MIIKDSSSPDFTGRWGDYSSTVADPDLDGTRFGFQEFDDFEGTVLSFGGESAYYQSEHAAPRTAQVLLIRDPAEHARARLALEEASARLRNRS